MPRQAAAKLIGSIVAEEKPSSLFRLPPRLGNTALRLRLSQRCSWTRTLASSAKGSSDRMAPSTPSKPSRKAPKSYLLPPSPSFFACVMRCGAQIGTIDHWCVLASSCIAWADGNGYLQYIKL
ncbi:hypothetical protein CRG98_007896 [Punica granatum]|uniref:Uncharacterized protein n=1 Tax=Punica granatum TaxID=22663 RepID=A0A2I0KTV7_PUNGR|nr:hypothetical protein CRG98_007896 [Punica granatum]